MAANLRRSGRPVHVWNRSQEPVQALAAKGARPAATPAECGIADIVFTMLADDAATRAVLVDGGVLDAMAPGSIHVRLAVEAGRDQGLPLAFGESLQATLQDAVAQGDADLDLAALSKHVARRGRPG